MKFNDLALLKVFILIGMGILSFKRTPYTVETEYKIPVNASEKVCIDSDYNPLHFMEDKVVTIMATHDQFSVANIIGHKNLLSDLLAVKYGKPDIDLYGHLVDSKRDGSEVKLVITPFQSACYTFVNEAEEEPLMLDVHTETKLCYGTLIFYVLSILAYLYCTRLFVLELTLIIIFFLYIGAFDFVHPYLSKYTWYINYIVPYFALPLLRIANGSYLFIIHTTVRLVDFYIFIFTSAIPLCKQLYSKVVLAIMSSINIMKTYINTMIQSIPSKETILNWMKLYWKEITATVTVIITDFYIFYPKKSNMTLQIRFACIVAIIAAIAYLNVQMAIYLSIFSAIIGILVIMLQDTVKDALNAVKRIIKHHKE